MKRVLVAIAVALCCLLVRADSPGPFPATLVERVFDFGRSKVVVEVDGREQKGLPSYTLRIFLDGKAVASCPDTGCQRVFASDDGQYFVGLSNSGVPWTAFIIFDAQGRIIRKVDHGALPARMYTHRTSRFVREWFDRDRPSVLFRVEDGQLVDVFVWGSQQRWFNVMKEDLRNLAVVTGKG
jgi:hypothetical protein